MKIKREVDFKGLINHIYNNNIKDGTFEPNGNDIYANYNTVYVEDYAIEFNYEPVITREDTWTIEEEIDISKDTKLPLVLVGEPKDDLYMVYCDLSIHEIEERYRKVGYQQVSTIYLINDDLTHTLIYKNGSLFKE